MFKSSNKGENPPDLVPSCRVCLSKNYYTNPTGHTVPVRRIETLLLSLSVMLLLCLSKLVITTAYLASIRSAIVPFSFLGPI